MSRWEAFTDAEVIELLASQRGGKLQEELEGEADRRVVRRRQEREGHEFDPDYTTHPGTTIRAWMNDNLSDAGFAQSLGIPEDELSGLLEGDVVLTVPHSLALQRVTKIPSSFWLRREGQFRKDLADGKTWVR